MPQSGYTPQGDTAVGGNSFTPPKKKKPKPAPYTPPASKTGDTYSVKLTADTNAAAEKNAARLQRDTNRYLQRKTLLNAAERQDYLKGIDERAQKLDPRLLEKSPGLAAELLMGNTATRDLAETSSAAADGLALQQVEAFHEAQRKYQVGLTENDIPQYFASQGALVDDDPVLSEYLKKAEHIEDPGQRQLFTNILIKASQVPPGPGRDKLMEFVPQAYNIALDTGWIDTEKLSDPDQSGLEFFTSNVGQGLMMPINAVTGTISDVWGGAADFAHDVGIPGFEAVSKDMKKYQAEVGGGLQTAATAGQWLGRNVQGGAAMLAEGPNWDDSLDPQTIVTTWNEAKEGGRSPISYVVADYMGTTVSDPNYQGLFSAIDLSADLVSQYLLFRGLGEIRTGLRATEVGGGEFSGAQWIDSELLGGKRFVRTGYGLIEDMPLGSGERINALQGKFKKGMTPTLARDLSAATSSDEFARIAAEHIDTVPDKIITENTARIKDIDAELTRQQEYVKAESTGEPQTFEEWRDARYAGENQTVMVSRDWLAERAENRTPRGETDVAPENYQAIKRNLEQNGWDPEKPLHVVYDYKENTFHVYDGTHRLRLAEELGIDEVPVEFTGNADMANTYKMLQREFPESLKKTGLTSARAAEIDSLLAERIGLEQANLELMGRETIYEFPRVSHVRPLMRGVAVDSWLGRQFNTWFGEAGKIDLSKLSNDLTPDDLKLIDPSDFRKPRTWATRNSDALRKTMNEARVPKAVQDAVVEGMFKVERGELSFFDWRKQIEAAYRTGLGKDISAEAEAAIRVSGDVSVESRMKHGMVEDPVPNTNKTYLRAIAEDEHGNPLPTRPSQLLHNEVRLPDMRILSEATQSIRGLDTWMKTHPYLGKIYGPLRTTGEAAHFAFLDAPRLVLRPAILASSVIRLAFKIEFDQSLRAFLSENVLPSRWWGKTKTEFTEAGHPVRLHTREALKSPENPEGDPAAMGLIAHEMLDEAKYIDAEMSTRGGVGQVGGYNARLITKSIYEHVNELSADPLTRRIALFGPDATIDLIRNRPEHSLSRTMTEDVMPKLEAKGYTLEGIIRDIDREIAQTTGKDLNLREAIGTHRWRTGDATPSQAALDRVEVADELAEARDTLALTDDPSMRRQLNLRIEELERRDARLEKKVQSEDGISLKDEKAFRERVLNNWREGDFEMPNKVVVKRRTAANDVPNPIDHGRYLSQQLNQKIYKAFKPMTKVTYDMSRGSTFRTVFDRVYADLVDKGWKPGRGGPAFREAQNRALFITKDLHYDISARSSFDRRLQNYFWFEPVWREQMLTYLWKVPSTAFWASGLALESGMAHTIIEGLKALGIADERVTFVKDGKEDKALFIGGVNVSGFDPLTPGGAETFVPTLSPGAEAILDGAANWDSLPEPIRGFIEATSEMFTFDHDVDKSGSFIPRTLTSMVEFFGYHIPPNTFTDWGNYNEKINRQVDEMAASKLKSEGITDPTDAQLATARNEIEKGVFAVHLLSATVVPGSIVTPGTDVWYDYRQQTILDESNYVDLALRQHQDWSEDDPGPDIDPVNNPADFQALSPRRQATLAANWTQVPAEDLTPTQREVVGDNVDFTPARRMANAGYFKGETAGWALSKADQLRSRVIAAGNSPVGYAEDTIKLYVQFFQKVDQLRVRDPAFDRQMRYLELGVSGEDYMSRVEAYERIFFGEPYSSVVTETLEQEMP